MLRLTALFVVIAGAMLAEARRATANERQQRARGGIEPTHDVYALMQVAYPGVFLTMLCEGLFRSAPPTDVIVAGSALFAAGKLLKWWAVATLGPFWTFRVIVVPGSQAVTTGPYRWMRHPNYVGVCGELIGTALVAGAPVAGTLGTVLFAGLMVLRVRVENRALNAILPRT
jgi:methyltransferase